MRFESVELRAWAARVVAGQAGGAHGPAGIFNKKVTEGVFLTSGHQLGSSIDNLAHMPAGRPPPEHSKSLADEDQAGEVQNLSIGFTIQGQLKSLE